MDLHGVPRRRAVPIEEDGAAGAERGEAAEVEDIRGQERQHAAGHPEVVDVAGVLSRQREQPGGGGRLRGAAAVSV